MIIQNPILRGFHPDPSLLRVGDDYYIAVSTFEWCPGVRIYHSKDLIHWDYFCSPLDTFSKMDLRGIHASDGVWAPCLSYDGEFFYLIYTVTHGAREFPPMDTPNYLIRSKDLKGAWSETVYLNSSGFDPSLFHDTDGKKYLVNMEWDYRKTENGNPFAGILLQEYDPEQRRLIGEPVRIFAGTEIGSTEGPHLYRHEGYYYLFCAEGGTGWFHAETVARSRKIEGPYEVHPANPLISSWDGIRNPEKARKELEERGLRFSGIQKAGHASLIETSDGRWYIAHLCARPIPGMQSCPMGRETALQEVIWQDGWPVLKAGGNFPQSEVEVLLQEEGNSPFVSAFAETEKEELFVPAESKIEYDFCNERFLDDFQTLRIPFEETGMTIIERPGYLRIYGKESIFSRYEQALLARRQTELCFRAGTCFEFHPVSYQHSAGLIYRYDEKNQYYAFVTYDEEIQGTAICLAAVCRGRMQMLFRAPVNGTQFELELSVLNEKAQFFYKENGSFRKLGPEVSVEYLSDDYADGFTGSFVGMCVQDLRSREVYADFERFWYITGKSLFY